MDSYLFSKTKKCLTFWPEDKLKEVNKALSLIGIHYMHYTKIFDDGWRISFTTNPNAIGEFYYNDLHLKHCLHDQSKKLIDFNIYWQNMQESLDVLKLRALTGVGNVGFSIVRREKKCSSTYHFAVENESLALLLMNQKINLIYHFINYFHSEYNEILRKQEKFKFQVSRSLGGLELTCAKDDFSNKNISKFLRYTKSKKFMINEFGVYLSEKEITILAYVVKGFSAKRIANELFRSYRTVEAHIENLRTKLNCSNTIEMVSKVLENNFLKGEINLRLSLSSKDFHQEGLLTNHLDLLEHDKHILRTLELS